MIGSLSIGEEIKWASKEGKSRKVKAAEVGKATWSTFGKHGTAVLRVSAASAVRAGRFERVGSPPARVAVDDRGSVVG